MPPKAPKSEALKKSGLKVVGTPARPLRLGVGGPAGSGKTTLVAALCGALAESLSLAVVLDDARGTEDARRLQEAAEAAGSALASERITVVPTGCSPQIAIREDIAANLNAVEALEAAHAPLDLVIVESGGTDATAFFSSGLVDRQIFVLDAAAGERAAHKGGPALARADLLLVNRTDLAPLVGADLEALRRDALALRSVGPGGARREQPLPTVFTSLAEHPHAPAVVDWVKGLIVERTVLVDA